MVIEPLGDSALLIRLGERIDEETHRRVAAVTRHLLAHRFPGMIEPVPAYTTVAVHYDPTRVGLPGAFRTAADHVRRLLETVEDLPHTELPPVEIAVCYGGELGPDLGVVARHAGLAPEAVARIHAAGLYRVYMIGFAPGFPFLGGLDPRLATPRRDSPRTAVPAGSVAIGGSQTGVYPMETPGGWQIIGRTRAVLFDAARERPTLLRMGDRVRFRAISREEFEG